MSQENVEIVRQGYARWRGDNDDLVDFLISNSAPDIELYSRFGGFTGEPYRGHDGLRAWLADIQEHFERFDPWLDEARATGRRPGSCPRRDQLSGEGERHRYG